MGTDDTKPSHRSNKAVLMQTRSVGDSTSSSGAVLKSQPVMELQWCMRYGSVKLHSHAACAPTGPARLGVQLNSLETKRDGVTVGTVLPSRNALVWCNPAFCVLICCSARILPAPSNHHHNDDADDADADADDCLVIDLSCSMEFSDMVHNG